MKTNVFLCSVPGVLSLFLLTGCPTTAPMRGPRVLKPNSNEVYTHAPSSFQFPPTVGGFDRVEVVQYDPSGANIGVGYNNQGLGIAATVFVYPIPAQGPDSTLKDHFERCKADVLRAHAKSEVVGQKAVQVGPGGQQRDGEYASFTYTELFAQARQPVRAELYLFTHGRWFIKYRTTYPVGQRVVAEPAVRLLVDELAWP